MELQEINSRQYKLHDLILKYSMNGQWISMGDILEIMCPYYPKSNDDRLLRKDIEILRSARNRLFKPIISGNKGYKMPINRYEWKEYYDKKHKEAVKQLAILEGQNHKIERDENYRLDDQDHPQQSKVFESTFERATQKHPNRPQFRLC